MYRRVVLIGLLWIGVVAMWAAGVSAHTAGMRLRADGTLFHASSVACHFEATGAGSDPTIGTCEVVGGTSAILFCLNPTNQQISGRAATQFFPFETVVGVGVATKKGKTRYDVVADATGLASSDDECNQDPTGACQALRQFCVNSNWVPFDVVPINMTVEVNTFACASPSQIPGTPCCDPKLPPNEQDACIDHDTSTEEVDPEGTLRFSCLLPNPDQYRFGDFVQYNCTLQP